MKSIKRTIIKITLFKLFKNDMLFVVYINFKKIYNCFNKLKTI